MLPVVLIYSVCLRSQGGGGASHMEWLGCLPENLNFKTPNLGVAQALFDP